VVITTYGHDKIIDKIAVNVIDESVDGRNERASINCTTINGHKLLDGVWISKKTIKQNKQYILSEFLPHYSLNDFIPNLDDRTVQKIIRSSKSTDMATALAGKENKVHEKIFKNMSGRAVKILKDNIQCYGKIPEHEIEESQRKIVDVIHRLIDTGEIVVSYSGEDDKEVR
jgi:hypothetical protein